MTNLRFEQAMANAVRAAAVNEEASNPELAKRLHDTADQANKKLAMSIDNMSPVSVKSHDGTDEQYEVVCEACCIHAFYTYEDDALDAAEDHNYEMHTFKS